MKKLIVIGSACLELTFTQGASGQPRPGGELLRLAAQVATMRPDLEVHMVSEVSMDPVGDMIVKYLEDNRVSTRSVDRYIDGVTPLRMIFPGKEPVIYRNEGGEKLDVVWPRIDPGDVLVFGGLLALEQRSRKPVADLIDYARTRKATVVYIPSVTSADIPRVTRVMPQLLENLEVADALIVSPQELRLLFDCDDIARCYRDHISFYCRRVAVVGEGNATIIDDNSMRRQPAEGPDELIPAGLVSSLCT